MNHSLSEQDFRQIAAQLAHPSGENGNRVADQMHESNIGMTRQTIASLQLFPNSHVLELGHGSARHVPELLEKEDNLHYDGLEISILMNEQSKQLNAQAIAEGKAAFSLYDGGHIPFQKASFDRIMTVNTVYFWRDPAATFQELARVLKKGGLFCLTFADKSFMRQLPFTEYGFTLYEQEELIHLAVSAGFTFKTISRHEERIRSKSGDEVERLFYVMTLQR